MRYTKDNLTKAASESRSMNELILILGLSSAGANYKTVSKYINFFDIDISHFSHQAYRTYKISFVEGKANQKKYTVDDLRDGSNIDTSTIRRLLKEIGVEEKCDCGITTEWNNSPIKLQIDHIDGNRFNNTKDNLRYICPNCHSQTTTYCGRNQNKYIIALPRKKVKEIRQSVSCAVCGTQTTQKKYCSRPCVAIASRKSTLSIEELYEIVKRNNFNYTKTGKEVGLSDSAVRKRIRLAGLLPYLVDPPGHDPGFQD